MRVSQTPITPQDLRDDARNAELLAEIAREVQSRDTLLALSQDFLDRAAQLESAMRERPASDNGATTPPTFGTPKYWQDRASEGRSMLSQLKNPEAREAMDLVIESYERLARIADEGSQAATNELASESEQISVKRVKLRDHA